MSCRQQLHVTWVDTFRPRITSGRETKNNKILKSKQTNKLKKTGVPALASHRFRNLFWQGNISFKNPYRTGS